ncbi:MULTISPECIES: hypothetical protein [Streptomyces]|uniref:Uncharacterized protein n=2 Tax=Streptomyces TaxID=1883 RepID=A0ABT9KI53_9ACTN|nr:MULTISPECIES: hypothetical protein [Streptomyces]MBW8088066.1 hypothetical protein [Streptomyces hygroscopicus subsp. hygroscopicus]MCO8302514.1 hypothetical protein [Streptomyces sp. RKCA744]MDP9608096.1 hypothetical protein [Streptomyces demainii]GHJ30648.1 hypothetical protein TPA0910_50810 [Streptomyces hygroscopicus]
MSQNWQQPQQPGGYPQQPAQPQQAGGYGSPQPGYGYPQGQPQPPQPQFGGGFPPPAPQVGRPGNPLLAVGAAIVATVVGAFLYAFLLSAMADTDKTPPEVTQFAYAGVVVGALIGLVVAKLGGRNPGLWVVGAVLALAAVFLGELYGYAMILHDVMSNYADKIGGGASSQVLSSNEIFFDHFSDLWKSWKEDSDALTYIFMALAPVAAVSTAYRIGNR